MTIQLGLLPPLGRKYDPAKVREAITRCSKRINAEQHRYYIDGSGTIQELNRTVDRWHEAMICLMRLIPKEYGTADLK